MIKTNYFGSYARHRTFVSERASADLRPNQYGRNEVVAMMRQYEEEFIAMVRKMTCNP